MGGSYLGLDVGGSSIKGGVVDLGRGVLATPLDAEPTPQPATPEAMMRAAAALAARLPSRGAVGIGFPAVVKHGRVLTAANIDKSWLGVDGAAMFGQALGRPVTLLNDADAAGVAEVKWGAGRGCDGVVMMLTFGTGIGSALFFRGQLLPNTELGHAELRGVDAEEWASARVRTLRNLDWDTWIGRVNEYLAYMHRLFWPDLFIVGGGVSERFDEFGPRLKCPTEIRPAQFAAQAGVVGAALAAASPS